MITSRTADKHRNHAIELGVNEYMGKPYQEDQLLGLIKRYTAEGSSSRVGQRKYHSTTAPSAIRYQANALKSWCAT